jgi:hypothetical protein
MNNLLYLANNDSSDTRIYKELRTLHKQYNIIYLGINSAGRKEDFFFGKKYCAHFFIINGDYKNPITLIKFMLKAYIVVSRYKIKSVHVVNEQILFLVYPLSFFMNIVLDQFDSIFHKKLQFIKKVPFIYSMYYKPIKKIIVTDENRKNLLPSIHHKKIIVLPNYPLYRNLKKRNEAPPGLNILYFGWLGKPRGSQVLHGLLSLNKKIKIISAGWISDKYTMDLFSKYSDCIDFHGVVDQYEALNLGLKADYIICVYEPSNDNNINASPNKIYDAIQIQKPVIMNSEIIVSKFVGKMKIGYIIKDYNDINYEKLYYDLKAKKGSFSFDFRLRKKYCWESEHDKLNSAHHFKN